MKFLDPRLLRYSRSSRGYLLATLAVAVATAVVTIMQAFLLGSIIVKIFQERLASVTPQLTALALVFGLRALLSYIGEQVSARIAVSIRAELRTQLTDRLLDDGANLTYKHGAAKISLLASRGISALDAYFGKFLPQIFIALLVPPMVGIVIFTQDKLAGIIVLATVPLIPLFGALIGMYTAKATEKRWRSLGVLSSHFLDLVTGLLTLKTFGRSQQQEENLEKSGEAYRVETMKTLRLAFLSSLALEIIATLSVALIAVSVGLRLVNGSMDFRVGLLVIILAPDVYWPLRMVGAHFHSATDGIEASRTLFEILDEAHLPEGTTELTEIDEIAFRGVVVAYPGRAPIALPDFTFTRGDLIALTGPSGIGKSTAISLLLRFITPTSGTITINGREISEYTLRSLRSRIAWIPQSPRFINATLQENLTFGSSQHTTQDQLKDPLKDPLNDQVLIDALDSAGLPLSELPQGLNTAIGLGGVGISVGQGRRLAVARALLRKGDLLLCDEPSASLDALTEAHVHQSLAQQAETKEGKPGAIVLFVTHREFAEATQRIDMAAIEMVTNRGVGK